MNKKVAICFSGQARSTEFTCENINQYLINSFKDVDTFAYLSDDENSYKALKYFNFTECVIEKDVDFSNVKMNHMQPSLQQYLSMNYSRKMVNELRNEYAKKHNIKYDIVIHSRLDIRFGLPLNMFKIEQMDMNCLYVPSFHNFPIVQGKGFNDRFAISSSRIMNIYFQLFDYIQKDSDSNHLVHGESTLFRYLEKEKIEVKKIPILFTRVNKDGTERDPHIISKPRHLWQAIEQE